MDDVSQSFDMEYEKVNIQDNPQYIDTFNIGSVPTVLLVKDGQEINRMLGATTADVVRKFIGDYA